MTWEDWLGVGPEEDKEPGHYGDYDYGRGDEPSHDDDDLGDNCGDTGDFEDGSYY